MMNDDKLIDHILKSVRRRNGVDFMWKEYVLILDMMGSHFPRRTYYEPDRASLYINEKLTDLGIKDFFHQNFSLQYPYPGAQILEVILFDKEEDGHLATLSLPNVVHSEFLSRI